MWHWILSSLGVSWLFSKSRLFWSNMVLNLGDRSCRNAWCFLLKNRCDISHFKNSLLYYVLLQRISKKILFFFTKFFLSSNFKQIMIWQDSILCSFEQYQQQILNVSVNSVKLFCENEGKALFISRSSFSAIMLAFRLKNFCTSNPNQFSNLLNGYNIRIAVFVNWLSHKIW